MVGREKLFYPADGMETVGVFFAVEDSLAVEGINPHETRGMHDAAIAHANAHMDDTSLGILEESKVVTLHITKAHLVATGHLL